MTVPSALRAPPSAGLYISSTYSGILGLLGHGGGSRSGQPPMRTHQGRRIRQPGDEIFRDGYQTRWKGGSDRRGPRQSGARVEPVLARMAGLPPRFRYPGVEMRTQQ